MKKSTWIGAVETNFPNTLENYMNTQEIIASLDLEISRLRQVRELLAGHPQVRRGRPKGSTNKARNTAVSFNPAEFVQPKRTMSPEGKERIAAAQRARWARQHTNAVTPSQKKVGSNKSLSAVVGTGKATNGSNHSLKSAAGKPGTAKRKVGRPAKDTAGAVPGKSTAEQAPPAAA